MEVITRNTPYSEEYIHKMGNVGFEPEFQVKKPKGVGRRGNTSSAAKRLKKKKLKAFKARSSRVPWDWE